MNEFKEKSRIRKMKIELLSIGDPIEAHVLPGTYDFEIVYELDVVYKISKNSIYVTWNPLDRLSERSVCLKIPKSQLKVDKSSGNLYYKIVEYPKFKSIEYLQ